MGEPLFTLTSLTPKNGLAFRPYIVKTQLEKLLQKNYYGIGLLYKGMACGALVGCRAQGDFEILSLFVDETLRHQGAASLLLRAAQGLLPKLQCGRISARYSLPRQQGLGEFFAHKGFTVQAGGGKLFHLPLSCLRESALLRQPLPALSGAFLTLEQLGREQADLFRSRLRRQGLGSWEVPGGKAQAHATWLYVANGQPAGYCGCSLLVDGSLYLSSFYAESPHAHALQPLLTLTLRTIIEAYPAHQTMLIAAAEAEEEKIIRYLCREYEEAVEVEASCVAVWQPSTNERKKITMNFEDMVPSFDILVPKLTALEGALREMGVESSLVLSGSQYPYLLSESTVGAQKFTTVFNYIATDPNADGHFVLNLAAQLPCETLDFASRYMLCTRFNFDTLGPMAYASILEENINLRSLFPEAELPVSPETLRFFVKLFQDGLTRLLEEMKETPSK